MSSDEESSQDKLVFSDPKNFKDSIENVESEKVFKLPDSHYQIYVTNIELEGRHFLTLIAAKKEKHHLELYEVIDDKFIEISARRRSKGTIGNQKQAAETSILAIGFRSLEEWGGGI